MLGSLGCGPVQLQNQNRDVVDVGEFLVLDAEIRRGLKPLGSCETQELLSERLSALPRVALVIQEVGYLLIRHDVPDAVRGHDYPLRDKATMERVPDGIIREAGDFRFGNDASLLGEDITKGA